MNKTHNYLGLLKTVCSLAILVTACTPAMAPQTSTNSPMPVEITPVESFTPSVDAAISPIIELTSTYSSAPKDETVDQLCRLTINHFFNFRKGFDVDQYRKLFFPYRADFEDAYTANPPTQPRTILVLIPASEWWQKRFPATPIPGALLPEGPDEYTYYVEFTGYYESDETPVYTYPNSMTMIMISSGPDSCKIKNYGKG
jgi:hypothetical protein